MEGEYYFKSEHCTRAGSIVLASLSRFWLDVLFRFPSFYPTVLLVLLVSSLQPHLKHGASNGLMTRGSK